MCRMSQSVLSSPFMTDHLICNRSNTQGTTIGTQIIYPSGTPDFIPGFLLCSCFSVFNLVCSVMQMLVYLFYIWPLYSLSFHLPHLICKLSHKKMFRIYLSNGGNRTLDVKINDNMIRCKPLTRNQQYAYLRLIHQGAR